ncbi:hypothetical protein NDU88_006725 [Pleurodeles waltl]|uniref:Uncharacterized protein n=1 Tax=Pleurodeles waltl TaxID=8319 RepID=A0AAV7UPV4_PLEWA|nr:hypothetical protein NDU88_006725 [Pleurodeles waltl]
MANCSRRQTPADGLGTPESSVLQARTWADGLVIGAAAANLQGTNAEGEGVQNKQEREEFSPGGEEEDVSECQMGGLEQTPGGRRRCEDKPSNPGEKPEEGKWEERRRKQTGHALGRVAQAGTVLNQSRYRGK